MTLLTFLSAGLVPPPSPAEMARELATARLSVASYLHRQEPLAVWLAIEIRAGGVREKAAVFAVLEALLVAHSRRHLLPETHLGDGAHPRPTSASGNHPVSCESPLLPVKRIAELLAAAGPTGCYRNLPGHHGSKIGTWPT